MDEPTRPPADATDAPDAARLDRRALLARVAGLAAAASPLSFAALAGCTDRVRRLSTTPTASRLAGRTFTPAQWRTLEAALDRLLPSEPGAPGARDVGAIGYLDAVLARDDVEALDPGRIRTAARRLDAMAFVLGTESYADLPEATRDEVLARLQRADPEGRRVVERLLYYALEAFLGDPVHGGNTDEVAWTWLGHVPGEPRLRRPGGGGPR